MLVSFHIARFDQHFHTPFMGSQTIELNRVRINFLHYSYIIFLISKFHKGSNSALNSVLFIY